MSLNPTTELNQAAFAANFQGTPARIGVTGGSLGFYGAPAVAQPTASADATLGAAGVGAAALVDTTYTGGAGVSANAYTIGGIVRSLKLLGLIA